MKRKIARGLRNNNPGNIRNSDAQDWKGEVSPAAKKDGAFEEFSEIKFGYRALIKLLQTYRKKYNCQTIQDFINKWAPPIENDTKSYIAAVCREMDVNPEFIPDINEKDTMCRMAAAISLVENGVPANMEDVEQGWNLL